MTLAFLAWLLLAVEAAMAVTALVVVLRAPLIQRYNLRPARRATLTATVVHPRRSPRPLPGRPAPAILTGRVIRGQVEPPRQVYGTTYEHQERERRKHQR